MTQRRSTASKVVTAILRPRPGTQAEFLQMLEGLRQAIAATQGCIECLVAQDVSSELRYVLFSAWTDVSALEAHLESEHFGILRGAADVLGTQSDVRFFAGDSEVAGAPRRVRS
jgi:quinol monooxygenase YgiN